MSWSSLPPARRELIAAALTTKQIDVYKLHLAGCGHRRASLMLGLDESTIRGHLDRALRKINKLDEQKEAA